jgi:hypothetical protein
VVDGGEEGCEDEGEDEGEGELGGELCELCGPCCDAEPETSGISPAPVGPSLPVVVGPAGSDSVAAIATAYWAENARVAASSTNASPAMPRRLIARAPLTGAARVLRRGVPLGTPRRPRSWSVILCVSRPWLPACVLLADHATRRHPILMPPRRDTVNDLLCDELDVCRPVLAIEAQDELPGAPGEVPGLGHTDHSAVSERLRSNRHGTV